MIDLTPLDHPVWVALTSVHQGLARSHGLARRYASDVSPLSALREPTPAAFADLRELVGPEESVGIFTTNPPNVPFDWEVAKSRPIDQMICTELKRVSPTRLERLEQSDVPEMLTLTAATEPGPFCAETIQMGRYFGIKSSDGRLIAMAGERLTLPGFTEISAVCTDAEHRGKGHAGALVTFLAAMIIAEGKIPFLNVKMENGAKLLYEKLGFRVRRSMQVTVLRPR